MPLTFDLSREELDSYTGRNPKPSNFDEFWDHGLAEMSAMNSNVELVEADFQTTFADCYHLYFDGVGGARIHAKMVRPKADKLVKVDGGAPAIIMFHGYSMNAGDWYDKLGYAALGYTVVAMDCRGQGGLSEDVGGMKGWTLNGHIVRGLGDLPEQMLYRHIFLDTAQIAGIVMDMDHVDETRVGVTGGSQGGGLTLACAALEPRVKLAAPVFPFLCDYQRVWEMDQAKNAYDELQTWFRRFDPLHEREEEVFTQLGYIDVQHLANRIQGEVMMSVGLMDQICPPSTQFAAYNKIESTKSLRIYPDYGHEGLPGNDDAIYQFMTQL